jgi:hypothetical protein
MQRDTKEVRGKYGKLQRKETALIGLIGFPFQNYDLNCSEI